MQNRSKETSVKIHRIKESARELKSVDALVMCAALVALYATINSLSIYVTPTLKLTFSFLVMAVIGYRFGIVTASIAGIACDLIAYIARPAGPLHLGFTLSTVLTCAVFALLLYKRELKLWRIIVSRTFINIFINIALNTYWLSLLYGKAYIVLLLERFIKNIALLPVEIALLWLVLKAFEKIQKRLSSSN